MNREAGVIDNNYNFRNLKKKIVKFGIPGIVALTLFGLFLSFLSERYRLKNNTEDFFRAEVERVRSNLVYRENLEDVYRDIENRGDRYPPLDVLTAAGISFSNRNLSGIDLSYVNLGKGVFHNANLSGAKLVGADIKGAYLNGAILDNADLENVTNEKIASQECDVFATSLNVRWNVCQNKKE